MRQFETDEKVWVYWNREWRKCPVRIQCEDSVQAWVGPFGTEYFGADYLDKMDKLGAAIDQVKHRRQNIVNEVTTFFEEDSLEEDFISNLGVLYANLVVAQDERKKARKNFEEARSQ